MTVVLALDERVQLNTVAIRVGGWLMPEVAIDQKCESISDTCIMSNVLLISGPSGAGKSTFINSLKTGHLSAELTDLLPENAASWPSVEANDLLKRGIAPAGLAATENRQPSIILHYDTFFIRRLALPDYSNDPVSKLTLEAINLTIVYIKPTPEELKVQFEKRLQEQMQRKGRTRSLWARFGRRQLKRLAFHHFGRGLPATADLYRSRGEIEKSYADWEKFLQIVLCSKPHAKVLRVTPSRSDRHTMDFSLASASLHDFRAGHGDVPSGSAARVFDNVVMGCN